MREFVMVSGWVLVAAVVALPVLAPVRLAPSATRPAGRHAAPSSDPPVTTLFRVVLWVAATGAALLLIGYLAWPQPHRGDGWFWTVLGVLWAAIAIDRLFRQVVPWFLARTSDGIYDPAARRRELRSRITFSVYFAFAVALSYLATLTPGWLRWLLFVPLFACAVWFLAASAVRVRQALRRHRDQPGRD